MAVLCRARFRVPGKARDDSGRRHLHEVRGGRDQEEHRRTARLGLRNGSREEREILLVAAPASCPRCPRTSAFPRRAVQPLQPSSGCAAAPAIPQYAAAKKTSTSAVAAQSPSQNRGQSVATPCWQASRHQPLPIEPAKVPTPAVI